MNTLHIFIKNPRRGYVKTRLAATAGDDEALRIYHILLQKTRKTAAMVNCERWLWYSDEIPESDEWPVESFNKKVQVSGDLGQRMLAAFEASFAAGNGKALIIGSDCPTLSLELLNEAFEALDHADVVVGPTLDGGYYLLGMNTLHKDLFENIHWSTEHVFRETCAKINAAGLNRKDLLVLNDIDEEADWKDYCAF